MFFEWYWVFLFLILVFHIRISTFSIYLHRGLSHRLITFSTTLHYCFRFVLWAVNFTWPNWIEWYCAQHRKHHRFSDTPDDPHTPHHFTLWQLLDFTHNDPSKKYNYISGKELKYYSPDVKTPKDWIQKNLYDKYPNGGAILLSLISLSIYGIIGCLITFFVFKLHIFEYISATLGNYGGHKWGYDPDRPRIGEDKSKNVFPIGILYGGEELHGNHHVNPLSAKFSIKWWEFDIGWMYIKILQYFKLLELRYDK
jgi:stearoyl-CoA desaturase (delta-9 desaturase)